MSSPYQGLPPERYWKTGVQSQSPLSIQGLYRKRYEITPDMKIATAGSCFAQHIARNMVARGYRVLDLEPAPPDMTPETARKFGYSLYSARYGNIYLARQLLQLLREALGVHEPKNAIWERDGRYFDALRPSVEPLGLSSPEEVVAHRAHHLARVRRLINEVDVFIFTLGLTEGWVHRESGTVYPTAPGTIAGEYDPAVYKFHNFSYNEILRDLTTVRALLKRKRPDLKMLFTVSPVPLTATATEDHILVATTYSKSTLRAVAGDLYNAYPDVDYFPSYELVAAPFSRGMFYSSNLREVENAGVESVMRVFFAEHPAVTNAPSKAKALDKEDLVCEELLLEAFAS